jgi:hypothetical protein
MIVFDFQRPINRHNVDNDYNYREELVEFLFLNRMVVFLSSESNGGISVFLRSAHEKRDV